MNSQRKFWFVIIAALIVSGLPVTDTVRADVNMAEGKWEVTTEMVMEGGQFQIPPMKTTQCITQQDAVPRGQQKDNCKVLSQSIRGNRVTWKVRCVEKESTSEAEGDITYSGTSYKGTMMGFVTEKGGKTQNFKMKLAGRRIGDCSEADKREKDQYGAQAEQAREQAQSYQQQHDNQNRGAVELLQLAVPEEGPGPCLVSDTACRARFGDLRLAAGQWEIVEETAGAFTGPGQKEPFYQPATQRTSVKCLTQEDALSYTKEQSCVSEKKRSGDRVTWRKTCTSANHTEEERGGITYNGETYDGVIVKKTTTSAGENSITTKVSARRLGDGNFLKATRDYTSRQRDSQPTSAESEAEKAVTNPVKNLKKIFGF